MDWIKIDVEGAEIPVLQGAIETLRRFKPTLWIELHGTEEEVVSFLHTVGYGVREVSRHTGGTSPHPERGHVWAEAT